MQPEPIVSPNPTPPPPAARAAWAMLLDSALYLVLASLVYLGYLWLTGGARIIVD